MPSMEFAKFKAILYADIFDCPLTKAQLKKWKIANQESGIRTQELGIEKTDGYYFLRGRGIIVSLRKKREEISRKKLTKARKVVNLLRKIPTIKMIALTGGLAMQNSKREDDIDLLIVAQRGALWLSRLLSILLLDLRGLRRRPGDTDFKDKICLNMFLEENYLTLPKLEQDLYGAHEVCQIKPLLNRDNAYERFLKANSWAKQYLPNAISIINGHRQLYPIPYPLYPLEWLAKFLQLWYMKRRRTTEVITDHLLRFHPKDYRPMVLEEYQKRLRQYTHLT